MKYVSVLLFVILAGAGCGRVQEKKSAPSRDVPTAPRVALPAGPTLPDYAARAKTEIGREQREELQAKAGQLKVELPPKKKP